MTPPDPLSKLLQQWQPEDPDPQTAFVPETLRRLRAERARSPWSRTSEAWTEFLNAWLPAPRILVPSAAAAIVFAVALQWNAIEREARGLAALAWQQTVSQPDARISLAGAWLESKKEKP